MTNLCAIAILALVSLPSLQGSFGESSTSWLDRTPSNWNRTMSNLPTPVRSSDAADSRSRCGEMIRQPDSAAGRALVRAGWLLYGPVQSYGPTKVVTALSGFDGMCRPVGHQAFVYWEERYAGTLAPQPMNSRTDGSLVNYRLVSQTKIIAEFGRYAPNDPLCCPTRTTYVTYEVRRDETPLVSPVNITSDRATASGDSAPSQVPGGASPQVAGRKWRLTAINGASIRSTNPYIQFDEATKKVSGDSGCNRITGSYELAGSTLRFSGVAATKKACLDFELQQVENNLQKALGQSTTFEIQGDTLRLSADGPMELTFKADSTGADTPSGSGGGSRVTGTVTSRQRIALSPDAVIEVKLVDVSRAQGVTIAERTIGVEGRQLPIQFELSYDPNRIQQRRRYVIQARILEGGQPRFIQANIYPVLTEGYPNTVNISVVPANR